MNIRNSNFISLHMDKQDIEHAFIFDGQTRTFINSLIAEGYLKKIGDRYYKPTEKLLDAIYLPDVFIMTADQRRYLTRNSSFTKSQLNVVFSDQIIKWLMINNWIYTDANSRYRKTEAFNDFLFEGNEAISFK